MTKKYPDPEKGDKFGRWICTGEWKYKIEGIIKPRKLRYFECICNCGTKRYVAIRSLFNGKSKSCGCITIEKATKYPDPEKGDKFGYLTYTGEWEHRKTEKKTGKKKFFKCNCNCGTKNVWVVKNNLIHLRTRSCGCYSREQSSKIHKINIKGQTFNYLKVIKENSISKKGEIMWLCECKCSKQTIVRSSHLRNNQIESCGCIQPLKIKKGKIWEKLVGKYLQYHEKKFLHHKTLSNKKIPDFISNDDKIIIEVKKHDYISIQECIEEKYYDHCETLIFACMEHHRKDWQSDFSDYPKVKFWYPEDFLTFIPESEHETFLAEIQAIHDMKDEPEEPEPRLIKVKRPDMPDRIINLNRKWRALI